MENLYEILGVDRNATNAEIKTAYRQLAAVHHPDRNNSPEAEERFKQVSIAYEILSDFYQRLQYEQAYDEYMGISNTQDDDHTIIDESDFPEETEEIILEESIPHKEPQTAINEEEKEELVENKSFGFKWKLALLATPVVILLCIALVKLIATIFIPSESKAETPPKTSPQQPKNQVESKPTGKYYNAWELNRMAVAQPDYCLIYIDTVKKTGIAKAELAQIETKAIKQLPAKCAYFFETNECDRARTTLKLVLKHYPNISPHLQKKLDFYNYRCAVEAKDYDLALGLLTEMEQRYQHHYSIYAAKSQLLDHTLKQPKVALAAYKQARQLYTTQQIDEKFMAYWQSDLGKFNYASLLAQEAQLYVRLDEKEKAKRMALDAINQDSTQALPYDIIGNIFIQEENEWGACKYWKKALENGSVHATDSLIKYCE